MVIVRCEKKYRSFVTEKKYRSFVTEKKYRSFVTEKKYRSFVTENTYLIHVRDSAGATPRTLGTRINRGGSAAYTCTILYIYIYIRTHTFSYVSPQQTKVRQDREEDRHHRDNKNVSGRTSFYIETRGSPLYRTAHTGIRPKAPLSEAVHMHCSIREFDHKSPSP